jgi:signal transduction histidine kinase
LVCRSPVDSAGMVLESLSRVSPLRLAHRLLAAGDAERQRIERDLHDGIQQCLTDFTRADSDATIGRPCPMNGSSRAETGG